MSKSEKANPNGQYIPLEYYTFVTSLTATLVTFGFVGLTWYITKLTRNVLLHTTLLISLGNTIPKLIESRTNMKRFSHFLIVFMVIISIPLASLDVLLNYYADIYISVGGVNSWVQKNVDSLGPLPYLDPVNLYVNPDYTNTPTSGALAALLQKSSNLSPNNANDSPGTFKYNKSCDDISNVLLNSAAQVSDDKYQITNSTFPSSFWNLPFSSNNESLVSIIWAMGPQVSPIFGGTPTNILNLAQLSLAINNSPQYSPTTSQVWFPIVGSNSKGFTYIYSEGYRGRQINESWWSTPGDEFRLKYDTNGTYAPPSNDTLHVRMVEVLDITFNRTTFTKGPALACFTYWYLDGQDAKCIVNLRRDLEKGTETYDVIVLVEPINPVKVPGPSLSPFANLSPVTSPVYIEYDQDKHSNTVSFASFCSNVLFVDSPLCIERYNQFDPVTDKLLSDNQMFLIDSFHYTVTIKSQSLSFYSNFSQNTGLITYMMSALQPLSGSCGVGSGSGRGLFTEKSYLPPGTSAVLIPYWYMALLIFLAIVAFLFFWYNDQYLLLLRYIGQPFNGLSGDVILEKSWIGVAEHEQIGWQVEVLSLTTTHKQTITCSSFTQAEQMRRGKIQQDLDAGRMDDPKDAIYNV